MEIKIVNWVKFKLQIGHLSKKYWSSQLTGLITRYRIKQLTFLKRYFIIKIIFLEKGKRKNMPWGGGVSHPPQNVIRFNPPLFKERIRCALCVKCTHLEFHSRRRPIWEFWMMHGSRQTFGRISTEQSVRWGPDGRWMEFLFAGCIR